MFKGVKEVRKNAIVGINKTKDSFTSACTGL